MSAIGIFSKTRVFKPHISLHERLPKVTKVQLVCSINFEVKFLLTLCYQINFEVKFYYEVTMVILESFIALL